MIIDFGQLKNSGIFKEEIQKDLYFIKKQKDQIDEKIYETQNRVKYLQEQEKKQKNLIANQLKDIKRKHQMIDFKENLHNIKTHNYQNMSKLHLNQQEKAKSFRDQHKSTIQQIKNQIINKKRNDALALQLKKQQNQEQIEEYLQKLQKQNQNNALKIKKEEQQIQSNINNYWKNKVSQYSSEKKNVKNDISLEAKNKEKILNNLINQENKFQFKIQEKSAQSTKLKQILKDNNLICQINFENIDKTVHLKNIINPLNIN